MIFRRILTVATAAAACSAIAINGPLPLGWRWTGKTKSPPTASPVLSGSMVIVPVGNNVYALDAATGRQVWEFPKGSEPAGEFKATVAVSGDTIIAANTDKSVFGINKNDGSKLWTLLLSGSVARQVFADKEYAYLITSDNRIVAVNIATGSRAWAQDYDIQDSVVGSAVFYEGDLIFYTGSSQLMSFSTTKQKPNWTLNVGSVPENAQPVIFDGAVWVVSGTQIAKLNARTGRPSFTKTMPAELAGSVAITPKGGVVATEDLKCYVIDLSGNLTSRKPIELRGYLAGSPQPVGDLVLVRSRAGALFLIDPSRSGGAVIWEYSTVPIAGMNRAESGETSGGTGPYGAGGGGGGTLRAGGGGGSTQKTTPVLTVAILGQVAANDNAIYALGDEGSVFAWGANLGVDETGPTITMLTPPQGSTLCAKPGLNIVFDLEDQSSGVMSKSISVTMNGQPVNWEYEPGPGYLWIRVRDAGSTTPGSNLPFPDGRKTITVSVADWMGNVTEKSFTLVVDNSLDPIKERGSDVKAGLGGKGSGSGGSGSG